MASEQGAVIVTRRAAVLGSPIAHSLSPALHRAAYRELGLDWSYDAVDVTIDQFPTVLSELQADHDVAGLSITMPLKGVALAAADVVSNVARKTNAANTLIMRGGVLEADNTDPEGIVWALTRGGARDVGTSAGIIGAGATARSSLAALAQLGISDVHVTARRPDAVAELSKVARTFDITVTAHQWREGAQVLTCPVVISTTPQGVADGFANQLPGSPRVLLDVVYSPWPTALAATWRDAGGTVVSGLEMLVGQAGRQVELMTGQRAPLDAMLVAGLRELGR